MTSNIEHQEFQRMIVASAAAHVMAFGGFVLWSAIVGRRFHVDPNAERAVNVIWATPLDGPSSRLKTPEHKLPGPEITPAMLPTPVKPETPRTVLREEKPTKAVVEPKKVPDDASLEVDRRRKAMAEALAKVTRQEEERPLPRPENFPSQGGGDKNTIPGTGKGVGQTGISGAFGGDPVFSHYRDQIRQKIVANFIWIQRDRPRAEVTFRIDGEGKVLRPRLSQSSGNEAFDRAALRAVERASPLPAPPFDLARDIVREDFVIRFDKELK